MPDSDLSFLPANFMQQAVVDCGGLLPADQMSKLNAQAQAAHFRAKIVILPPHYSPQSMRLLTSDIALKWHMPNDGLLMVINVAGHNLRLVAGTNLKKAGFTDQKITELIATRFGPSMRKAHSFADIPAALPDALSNMIDGVNHSLPQSWTAVGQQTATQNPSVAPNHPGQYNMFSAASFILPIAIVAAVIMSYLYLQRRKQGS